LDDAVTAPAPATAVDLSGKVVLVTGAGAGIGRGICEYCAQAGAGVVITGPGDNVDETAALAKAAGGNVIAVKADVSSAEQMQAAVALAVERFGGLDTVVHNATSRLSSHVGSIAGLTDDVWDDHVAVSLDGAYNCARYALPELQKRGGRLVLMTSPAAMEGSPLLPAYAAVKGALRGFTKSLAIEWGPLGVTVAAISPLAMSPALVNAYRENPALEARLSTLVPLGRVGDPLLDIAPVVAFLASDGSRYVTGQTITVDGGRFTTL
jgi:NAD(P)-dependent dehydrogenase (short-subunit alcohol dehydrogenase family)